LPRQYETLSLGVFIVIVALVLGAFSLRMITRLDELLALIIAFYGVWTVVLAGVRTQHLDEYGRGAYSTLVMGILLIGFGGAWFLTVKGADPIFSVALFLLVIGILAVASGFPSMRRKQG